MITYKQWKNVNESFVGTFGSILAQPNVVGGVVGATGASSLEETKNKIRKYMLGESDDEDGGDPKSPKKKKPPMKGEMKPKRNPFGGGGGGFGGDQDDDDDDQGDDDMSGLGDDQDDDMGGDDQDNDMGGDDDGGFGDDMKGGKVCPTCGHPQNDDDGMDDEDSLGGGDMDDDQDDDDMGGDDMNGGMGDDDGMGGGDDLGGMGGDDGMGDEPGAMGGMGDDMGSMGGSAKGNVCDKCGHHEPDKNSKFCKMCGKCMSKFMKKYMSADNGAKKTVPWLDKMKDNGEVKKGGKETGKDMSTTVKGGKKDPGRDPNKTGGKTKTESHRICNICGLLACEVHDGSAPNATRLSKSFFKSLSNQVGNRGGRFDNGLHDSVVEDALYAPDAEREPFPGEPGYAPVGRIGGFLG